MFRVANCAGNFSGKSITNLEVHSTANMYVLLKSLGGDSCVYSVTQSPRLAPARHTGEPFHYEIWKYYLSIVKAHAKALQSLRVHLCSTQHRW